MKLKRPFEFFKRQGNNYGVMLFQRLITALLNGFKQYNLLFAKELGADPMSLGYMKSVGLGGVIVTSPSVGWLGDRFGAKKVLLIGRTIALLVPVIYALAFDWRLVIPAVVMTTIAFKIHEVLSFPVVVNSLRKEDVVTGLSFLGMVARGVSILTPPIAAYLVVSYGGISVEGIRPLFYIQIVGEAFILLFLVLKLSESKATISSRSNILGDFKEVFRRSKPGLSRMLFLRSVANLCFEMTIPFISIFAVDVKNAGPYTLGAMTVATSVGVIVGSIPGAKLGDKLGRKKAIFLFRVPLYLSMLLLVFARNSYFLVLSQGLIASFWIGFNLFVAMTMELVDNDLRGRLNGLVEMFKSILGIFGPVLWGLLWTRVNPSAPYLFMLLLDVLIMMPILYTIPETYLPQVVEIKAD